MTIHRTLGRQFDGFVTADSAGDIDLERRIDRRIPEIDVAAIDVDPPHDRGERFVLLRFFFLAECPGIAVLLAFRADFRLHKREVFYDRTPIRRGSSLNRASM